ncbi:MAG: hypothetical protein AAF637_09505, partial [Pseudomonadota bacterium]
MTDQIQRRQSRRRFAWAMGVNLTALGAAMISSSAASAQDALQSFLSQDTLTGDWGGLRTKAENAGLTVEGNYQTDLLGNPSGGNRKRFVYAG